MCSLWRQPLLSVRARDPVREDLVNSPGKWNTTDEGIQHLRESAVLEVTYSDPDDENAPADLEDVPYPWAMWKKVIQHSNDILHGSGYTTCADSVVLAPEF